MTGFLEFSTYFGFFLSIAAFLFGDWLSRKVRHPLCNSMLIAVVLIIALLKLFRIDYETYNAGAKYLSFFITPAVVCLAIPVYQQFSILRKNTAAILAGVCAGMLACFTTVLALAALFRLGHAEYVTFLPKSVTTAIGIAISEEMGGYASITAAVIAITGLLGNLLAVPLCRLLRIEEPLAKGLAIGTSAHAIGAAKALELGEVESAVCNVAIVIAGLAAVIGVPVFAALY
jgi:putative effector of murein hydrolase